MVGHILWYWNNTYTDALSQRDVGPFNPGTVSSIFKVQVHGNFGVQSVAVTQPWVHIDDILWGFQWVPHGSPAQDVLVSSVGDQWLWRHNVAQRTDTQTSFEPSTGVAAEQATYSLWEEYNGQGNKPNQNIDVFLSMRSVFGVTSEPVVWIGAIDFYYG